MARALAATGHARWSRNYLLFGLKQRHRVLRTLVLLAGYLPPRDRAVLAAGRAAR